jgi:geranylgeranyl diphosphate synthase type 3
MSSGEVVRLWKLYFRLDDIYDGSVARRGVPVMHSIYGLPHTLNSVNYATSNALEKLLDLGDPRVFFFRSRKILF